MEPSSQSPADLYWQYIQRMGLHLSPEDRVAIATLLETVNWGEPKSALDANNFAVMALIEAEQWDDLSLRSLHLDLAVDALLQSGGGHPLCVAHLSLLRSLTGNALDEMDQGAFSTFVTSLHPAYQGNAALPCGLVYLPFGAPHQGQDSLLQAVLTARDGYQQALILLSEMLCRSQRVFYSLYGQRFLQLATQVWPHSAQRLLQLGLATVHYHQWEGLVYLHRASALRPNHLPTLHALHLAHRDLEQGTLAVLWQQSALNLGSDPEAEWATLAVDSPFTYVPFNGLQLAVEPSLGSIATIILLGQGDWFETEMELWRNSLKPGMTVIDVGANIGVYTFSAAAAVGPAGRVLAIEPFSYCVQCLRQTQHRNHLDWVTIYSGAASDRVGMAQLSLQSSSELNRVIATGDRQGGAIAPNQPPSHSTVTIDCFPLDSLIEGEPLHRVDWLKLDAEGHEMQVLLGSDRLLQAFRPAILYENDAGSGRSNRPVAEFLQSRGYRLFRYRPYLQMLVPLTTLDELDGNLNVIALPAERPS